MNSLAVLWVVLYLFQLPSILGILALLLFTGFCLLETFLLFKIRQPVKTERLLPGRLSNGDENTIKIYIENMYPFRVEVRVIDEIPHQFQKRDFEIELSLEPGADKLLSYTLSPVVRGEYNFGRTHFFLNTSIGLIRRRVSRHDGQIVPVYPSFFHLRKFEIMALQDISTVRGYRKIRRLGHSMEFEQIKDYVPGDDIRTINWKATSRRAKLMVNHYTDEISQPVYSIIDAGRLMKLPFRGMRLLDYAVNTSLMISDVALHKEDRAGLGVIKANTLSLIKADRGPGHLNSLMEMLYNLDTDFSETDFESFSVYFISKVRQRSLVILFTNFETENSLQRNIRAISRLAQNHLVIVIFFKNTEITGILQNDITNEDDIYLKQSIGQYMEQKAVMMKILEAKGINTIYTTPHELNINVFNKYIEFKRRGLL